MKIKDILKLKYTVENDYHGVDEEVLYVLTDDMGSCHLRIDDMENVEIRQYIKQENFGDNRARDLYCICYKCCPVLLYQYVGKGNYTNVTPLDNEAYREFKKKVLEKYIEENSRNPKCYTLEDDIMINTYGLDYEIRDNEIICLTKETK